MSSNRAYVRIDSVSSDGDQTTDFVLRSEFEIPPSWKPLHVVGVYGTYTSGQIGLDRNGEFDTASDVTWSITVDRQ